MWIQTQNKQRIVNSDQIIDIFISMSGTKICANTTVGHHEPGDTSQFILGEYKDRDTCLGIVEHILIAFGKGLPMTVIPFSENIDEWCEIIESANFE